MIKRPNWCKNAIPTTRGWVSPRGELLKSQVITEAQIAEFNGTAPTMLIESPPSKPIEDMSNRELNELVDHHGVDKPKKKTSKLKKLLYLGE